MVSTPNGNSDIFNKLIRPTPEDFKREYMSDFDTATSDLFRYSSGAASTVSKAKPLSREDLDKFMASTKIVGRDAGPIISDEFRAIDPAMLTSATGPFSGVISGSSVIASSITADTVTISRKEYEELLAARSAPAADPKPGRYTVSLDEAGRVGSFSLYDTPAPDPETNPEPQKDRGGTWGSW